MTFQEEIDKAIKERWIYFVGDRLPSDWYAAFKEWRQLAEAGDVKAQVNVGWCNYKGLGTEVDLEEAGTWFAKAAAQSDARAYTALFWLFHADGFKGKDPKVAEEYLAQAAALQEPKALGYVQERIAAKTKADRERAEAVAKSEKEAANRLQKERGVALTKAVQEALDLSDRKKAKQLLLGPDASGVEWAVKLLPYLELTTTAALDSEKDKTYLNCGVVNGTTQTQVTTHRTAIAHVSVKNPTEKQLACDIGGKSWELAPKSTTVTRLANGNAERQTFKTFKVRVTGDFLYFQVPFTSPISLSGASSSVDKCFVLTACYGDEDHPVVKDFRRFRDEYLLRNRTGEWLVSFYYRVGPTLADGVSRRPRLMAVLRGVFGQVRRFLPQERGD